MRPAAPADLNDPTALLVVLTGAGISAESGIPTFRTNGGLWRSHRFQDLATPQAFANQPELVWAFYQWRQEGVLNAQPNRAHHLLVELEQSLGDRFLLVTQNVDDLHERAGSRRLLHLHGEITKARCRQCQAVLNGFDYQRQDQPCPACTAPASLRPHIVWFGETPLHMDEVFDAVRQASHFLAIGSSGAVYPAAQFVDLARREGARTALINLDPADNQGAFHRLHQGSASAVLATLWSDGLASLGAGF